MSGGPARGYSWPPFEPGNEAATRHGAQSERRLRPIVDELLAGLERIAPWCSAAAFAPTVEAWAWAEAQAVLYRRHFDAQGLGLDDDDDEPAGLSRWDRAEGRAAKFRAELGLSPASLTKLLSGLSSIDAPAAQTGLDALREAGAAIRSAASTGALPAGPEGLEQTEDGVGGQVAGQVGRDVSEEVHTPLRRGSHVTRGPVG